VASIHRSLNKEETDTNSNTNKLSNVVSIAKVGIDGKELTPIETPKVKGYSFVEPSPSPMPGRLAGDESPMMTWGEIESTPFRLDGSATPYFSNKLSNAPEFKIPDVPEREKIALNLEEKANAARRKKKDEALKNIQRSLTSPSRSTLAGASMSEKINQMSPAAQRLLSSKLHLKTDKTPLLLSSKSSSSTPSPYLVKPSPSRSPFIIATQPNTNKSQPSTLKSALKRQSSSDSLTDNLLKLPKT
jgi:protein DGCR14